MYGNERPLLNNYSARAGPAASYRARQIIGHGNELDDRTLRRLLDSVQRKLLERRGGMKTTLVVHGGIISVLGYGFRSRTTDVDYIERVLPEELNLPASRKKAGGMKSKIKKFFRALRGKKDATLRTIIKECVAETANEFNNERSNPLIVLEHDWMNSAADVALPWQLDTECYMIDPLVISAVRDQGTTGCIIYDSPGLQLLGITFEWMLALKLQRYTEADEQDVVYLLQSIGECTQYDDAHYAYLIEQRLLIACPVMEYEHYPERALQEWRARLLDCVRKAKYMARNSGYYPGNY